MKDEDVKDVIVPLPISVEKFLLAKGLEAASITGIARNVLLMDTTLGIGILYKDPDIKPKKYLFGLFTSNVRRMFIGIIYYNSARLNANKGNWVIQVNGSKYVKLAKELAGEMAKTFNVKVSIHLEREDPKTERCLGDYDH